MAKAKKVNPKAMYYTDKLVNIIDSMHEYPITAICAPAGFGKTSLLRKFYDELAEGKAYWINVYSSDVSDFWIHLCAAFKDKTLSDNYPSFPQSDEEMLSFIHAIQHYQTNNNPLYILIDNAEYIISDTLKSFLLLLIEELYGTIHIVISSASIIWAQNEIPVLMGSVAAFQGDSFLMDANEVSEYFINCGIEISSDDARYIANSTGGWFSIMQMLSCEYARTGTISPRSRQPDIIFKHMFETESVQLVETFLPVALCPSFTREQIDFLSSYPFTDELYIEKVRYNSFLYYNRSSGQYFFHPILRTFLGDLLNTLPQEQKSQIFQKQGNWYRHIGDSFGAIRSYYYASDFNQLLDTIANLDDVAWTYESKDSFAKYFNACSPPMLRKYPMALLKFLECFIYFDDQNLAAVAKEQFLRCLNNPENSKAVYNTLAYHYELVKVLISFNNLDLMIEHFGAAEKYLPSITTEPKRNVPIYSGSAVLFPLLYKSGGLDSCLDRIYDFMNTGDKVNSNLYFGVDYLVRAEADYYTCQWAESEIYLQKARWRCDRYGNINTMICILFLDSNLAFLKGDIKQISDNIEQLHTLTNNFDETSTLKQIVSIIECIFDIRLNRNAKSARWIQDGEIFTTPLAVPVIPTAYIAYCGFLLSQKKYSQLIALEESILQSTSRYTSCILSIYIHVYLAIAYEALGFHDDAARHFERMLALATPEKLYMPIIENYARLTENLLHLLAQHEEDYSKIKEYYGKYSMGVSYLTTTNRSHATLSLSTREMEIAKMVASGATNDEIAVNLNLSVNTVKAILKAVFKKLDISSRREISKILEESLHPHTNQHDDTGI